MSPLLIKDQNLEENSKTYLIMLSLTIARLQGIIPKLMALKRGWFRHARKDFQKICLTRNKEDWTWPYLTSPWVTRCPNTPFCLISFLTFYFLVMDLDSPATCAKVITERVVLFKKVMPMAMEIFSIAQH
jgi:hypothetical protein